MAIRSGSATSFLLGDLRYVRGNGDVSPTLSSNSLKTFARGDSRRRLRGASGHSKRLELGFVVCTLTSGLNGASLGLIAEIYFNAVTYRAIAHDLTAVDADEEPFLLV